MNHRMEKPTQNLRAIFGIIPVAIISSVIIASGLREERCYGLSDAFASVGLKGGLIITLIICLAVQLRKIVKKDHTPIRILNLAFMMLFSGVAFGVSNLEDDYFQEPSILTAEIAESLSTGKIILREKNNFTAQYGHIDWSCVKVGKYEISNDTLILGERISHESNNIIASKYLIQGNVYLIPIGSHVYTQDSSRWMKINEIEKANGR